MRAFHRLDTCWSWHRLPPTWPTHGTLDSLFSATAARQNSSFPHKNVCRTAPRAFHPPTSRREANTSYSLVSLVSIVFIFKRPTFCCTFPSLPVPGVVSESGKVGQPDPHVYPRYCGFSTYARLPSVHEVLCENKIWNVQVADRHPKNAFSVMSRKEIISRRCLPLEVHLAEDTSIVGSGAFPFKSARIGGQARG